MRMADKPAARIAPSSRPAPAGRIVPPAPIAQHPAGIGWGSQAPRNR